ncbi:hypothetical protein FHS38_002051 [Streptomyces netropsis]|uniref:Uncharacterized protein n=1 Tax=Streptomyces netropsis TaxID=55404 RepID=A0A7W7PDW4_STRNE|nr:hypothetical protein [Streptomyces netropsis]GGR17183.1 hypothetical protein GCM10010219_22680 [Streptomyces netropsis]
MTNLIAHWFGWVRAPFALRLQRNYRPPCPRPEGTAHRSETPRGPASAVVVRMSAHGIDIVTRPQVAAR